MKPWPAEQERLPRPWSRHFKGLVDSPVSVKTRGGEILVVHFEIEGKKVKKVFFEGDVHIIYEGEMWEEAY